MKILMSPRNHAGQPILLVKELQEQGVDARLLQYASRGNTYGYKTDIVVPHASSNKKMLETLRWSFREGFDIYHFWNRSLFFLPSYLGCSGIDIPLIKARGKRVVYRFTGFDLRLSSEDKNKNRYSPFHYGYNSGFDEELQRRYIDFLKGYVDQFIVQDPEMHSFFPEARVVPRVMNLDDWKYVGVADVNCPLVVHAPSSKKVKGSGFVDKAVEELQSEGLHFKYKAISGMTNSEARKWYERADIIIDQLLIGWYGVLALEGMALGKPVIVYIRDELLDRFEHDVPIQNANPDTIKESLRTLIKDSDLRKELGQRARSFVETYHDVRRVVPELKSIYRQVLNSDPVSPTSDSDVDYFEQQLQMMSLSPKAQIIDWRNKLSKLQNSPNKMKVLMRYVKQIGRLSS